MPHCTPIECRMHLHRARPILNALVKQRLFKVANPFCSLYPHAGLLKTSSAAWRPIIHNQYTLCTLLCQHSTLLGYPRSKCVLLAHTTCHASHAHTNAHTLHFVHDTEANYLHGVQTNFAKCLATLVLLTDIIFFNILRHTYR